MVKSFIWTAETGFKRLSPSSFLSRDFTRCRVHRPGRADGHLVPRSRYRVAGAIDGSSGFLLTFSLFSLLFLF